jgi:hypothetical protein
MVRLSRVVALTVLCPMPLAAQADPSVDEDMLNLFFDCQTGDCFDSDFFRREVPVVNWVLDREVADVHVLVTSQATGCGGHMFTLAFIGRGDLEGDDQELTISTAGDATPDEQRQAASAA